MRPITYAIDAQGTIYIGNRVIARDNPDNPQSAADLAGLVFRANAASELLAVLEITYTSLIARLGPSHSITCQVGAAIAKAKGA